MVTSVVSGADWAELPKDLLDTVLEKLVAFSDYVRFAAVCVPWYQHAKENRKRFAKKLDRQVPMLLFPQKDKEKEELKNLYNVATKKFMNIDFRVPFSTRYGGSSRGWLIIMGEDFCVTLINPISPRVVIRLPPLVKNEQNYNLQIHKAILSADPTNEPNDYTVAAIYGDQSQLAFIKPGKQDADWTYIDKIRTVFEDIIYYKGRLHAIAYTGDVFCFDDKPSLPRKLSPTPKPKFFPEGKTYLIESLKGDLLLVFRHFKFYYKATPKYRTTVYFEVYKWNPSVPLWVEMKSLGGESLFLGDNMSTSILASDFLGCSPNSVYFTHSFDDTLVFGELGPTDSGVFNLEDSSFAPHYVTDKASLLAMAEQPLIWFMPNFLSVELFSIRTLNEL